MQKGKTIKWICSLWGVFIRSKPLNWGVLRSETKKGKRNKMKKLKVKIEFDCLANKEETEKQLNSIINYQIYEKIWNVDFNKGVKLTINEKRENEKI